MSTNSALFERAQRSIPGGVNSPVRAFRAVGGTPRFIASAQGAYMVDAEGRRYIDYIGSWGPMILGHGHPAVLEAVQRAVTEGLSFGAPTEREIETGRGHPGPGAQCRAGAPGQLGHRGRHERHPAGARLHRPLQADQVRGLLPRPCRRPAGEGGLRPGHLRPPHQRRRAARGGAAHPRARVQPHRPAGSRLRRARPGAGLRDDRAHRRQHELRARQRALHEAPARALHPARRLAGDGRGDDGIPCGAGRGAKPLRRRHPRLQARPERLRQGHRRLACRWRPLPARAR